MENVHLPACLPANPFIRAFQINLGRMIKAFDHKAVAAVEAGQLPAHLSFRERAVVAAVVDEHRRAGTLEALAPLHSWFWKSEEAATYHERGKDLLKGVWLQHQAAIAEPIRALVDAIGSPFHTLVEIGCGSGFALADLATRLPRLPKLIGLDMCATQIEIDRKRNSDPRLSFEAADANVWIPANATPGTIFLTVGGVFEYFPQKSLETLFAYIGSQLKPAAIAMIEPLADDYDLMAEVASRTYGNENSLGHNYPTLLRRAGFVICYQQEHRLNDTRFISVVGKHM